MTVIATMNAHADPTAEAVFREKVRNKSLTLQRNERGALSAPVAAFLFIFS
jgi:hypothetical protein